MAAQDESKGDGGTPSRADERRARLERALRANLLKRKAKDRAKAEDKTKAGKAPPPDEGRQS